MVIDYHVIISINHPIDTMSHTNILTCVDKYKKSFHGTKIIPLLLLLAVAQNKTIDMSLLTIPIWQ